MTASSIGIADQELDINIEMVGYVGKVAVGRWPMVIPVTTAHAFKADEAARFYCIADMAGVAAALV